MNYKQIIAIIVAVLSVLVGATSQLTDLFGPTAAKTVISVAGLTNTILSSILAAYTSNYATVKDASNVTGVEPLQVNRAAPPAIAQLAVDPSASNVSPLAQDEAAVNKAAKG